MCPVTGSVCVQSQVSLCHRSVFVQSQVSVCLVTSQSVSSHRSACLGSVNDPCPITDRFVCLFVLYSSHRSALCTKFSSCPAMRQFEYSHRSDHVQRWVSLCSATGRFLSSFSTLRSACVFKGPEYVLVDLCPLTPLEGFTS